MRWRGVVLWIALALWAALYGWQEYRMRRQARAMEQLRREVETVQTYLPTLLRSEFAAHERRMWSALNERLPK